MSIMLVVLLGVTAIQPSGEWQQVSVSSSGTKWLVRADDIANETNMNPTVWVSLDFSADRTVQSRSAKRRVVIDCAAATYQVIANIEYNAQGVALQSSTDVPSRYSHQPIVPETVTEDLAKAVCPFGKYGG